MAAEEEEVVMATEDVEEEEGCRCYGEGGGPWYKVGRLCLWHVCV